MITLYPSARQNKYAVQVEVYRAPRNTPVSKLWRCALNLLAAFGTLLVFLIVSYVEI